MLEFLKMIGALGAAFAVLAWLGSGQRRKRRERDGGTLPDDAPVDDMGEIGAAGGLLGGEMEDVFVGRFALRRRRSAADEDVPRSGRDV